jgi:alpha/beta superfamily hydrolase
LRGLGLTRPGDEGLQKRGLELRSPAGRLAALHDEPRGAPPARGPRAAVVCHPHPVQGGTMHNKVVHAAAKALAAEGLHVLRFDFRGAGGSEGIHDGGRGEQDDVRAALDAAARLAGPPADGALLVAGFSFGSFVGLSVGLGDPRVAALLAIAPPVNTYDFSAVAQAEKPLGVILAEQDELVPAADVEAFIARCRRPPWVARVPGAGHLFHARLAAVREAVAEFARARRA